MFRPSRPDLIVDARVRKLQVVRAWAGIVVTLAVAAVYRVTAPKALASERFDDAWINVLILTCVLPLVVGAPCYELRRLRLLHGITLRNALLR